MSAVFPSYRLVIIGWISALIALPSPSHAQSQSVTAPRNILFSGATLQQIRQQHDAALLHQVRIEADEAMKAAPVSVMDNHATPPSGDRHDYMSLAPYFWPNPATPNHLPYVRHDGLKNPEAAAIDDHDNLPHMAEQVHALALGYFFTRDELYAKRAALLLQVWFLDPATHMNPNLKFAQAVLGVNDGRGTGILEARWFANVVDALALLQGSNSLTVADDSALHAWFNDYFTWLTTSANGKDEAAAKNNHGSWDDVQTAAIAIYLDKTEFARDLVEAAKKKRIGLQISADGQQPLEEARTKSFSYCVFNLQALTRLATIGQAVGVDLWSYKAEHSGSIRAALNYLLPFVQDPKAWGHENIEGMSTGDLRVPLLRAAVQFHDAGYESAAMRMKGPEIAETLLLEREFALTQTKPGTAP
jgi:Alginate lyase